MRLLVASLCVAAILCGSAALATSFNGVGENERDDLGYYYIITGGKFPTGNTPNGDRNTGGTFRYLTDDPAWDKTTDTWLKDGWFPENAGFAVTLKNQGNIVYDNNGIEDGTYGNYYDATAQGRTVTEGTPGLYRGFSMSNNYDWIYAGYFKIEQTTTVDTIIGYFDANAGFNPNGPWKYRMNIWSNVAGDLLPVNTSGFDGDVFCSDNVAGTFAWSDTGVDRVIAPDLGSVHDDILRQTFTLNTPITLQPGIYWFSHDASVVPEPGCICVLLGGLAGMRLIRRRK